MVQQQYAASSYHNAGLMSKPSEYGAGSGKSDMKHGAFGKSMGSGSSLSSTTSGRSTVTSSSSSSAGQSPWGQFQNASHFKHMHNY